MASVTSPFRRSSEGTDRRPSIKDAAELIIKQQRVVRAFVDEKKKGGVSKGGCECCDLFVHFAVAS